ncbi:GGDEF domain-containing protein [Leucobacter sp. VD1]|uniref:GGDEF domain-containing protein n=1 Tax=Leucobacter sp. VD1 TaxID=3080381 RepID=UPI0030164E6B
MTSGLGDMMAGVLDRAAALLRRWVRWQTPFSTVSALIPLMLVLVFASDLLVGHPHIQRWMVVLWLVLYLLLAVIPLVLGRRYPLWAGLVVVAGMEAWSSYFLLFSRHSHAEINALLELPLVALYVAWFYPTVIAWGFIGLSMVRVSSTLIWNPNMGHAVGSPIVMIGYALIIMLFCFEGARAVRRQLRTQASIDALTGALNRRGMAEAGSRMLRRSARLDEPLAVAVIDFDDFKHVNDAGGHAAGDTALRESVRQWSAMVGMRGHSGRGGGFVARLGGDEFLLVAHAGAGELEANLSRAHEESPFSWSWGVVVVQPSEGLDGAIARADAALYLGRGARRLS